MKWRIAIVILIALGFLLIGALSPEINSVLLEENNKQSEEDTNIIDSDIRKTGYDDDFDAYVYFHWMPRYPDPDERITFYSDSYVNEGQIIYQRWDFNDGNMGYGPIASNTYSKKGNYRVTLYVYSRGYEGGYDWDYITRYVEVGEDPFPQIICTPKNPIPGEEVKLDASNSYDPDGGVATYKWSYYDVKDPANKTNIGSGVVVYHTWKTQGTYIVSLIIEDNSGNNNTIDETVCVSILRLDDFPSRSRGLNFKISNHGNFTAKNIKWTVEIKKYSLLGLRSRTLFAENNTISSLKQGNSEQIWLDNIRRIFRKVTVVVTVSADNAVEISETFYGLMLGKKIYLSERNFINPYKLLTIAGIIIALIASSMITLR
jgi:hypothetical protein